MEAKNRQRETVDRIINESCNMFSCTRPELLIRTSKRGRTKENIALAKHAAITLISSKTKFTDNQITSIFGVTRTTASKSRNTLRKMCEVDIDFRGRMEQLEKRIS